MQIRLCLNMAKKKISKNNWSRQSISDRIDELVDEMKGDWKKLFMSETYGLYVRHYIETMLAGVYKSLQMQGAQISQGLLDDEKKKFVFERVYDPNSTTCPTACTISDGKGFKIVVNGAGELVNHVSTVEEKSAVVLGLVVHEVGHRLFTDYRVDRARQIQLSAGMLYPKPDDMLNTPEGIILQHDLLNEEFRATFALMMNELINDTEDGYIENEIKHLYPGTATNYLNAVNDVAFETSPTMTDMANEKEPSKVNMLLAQWLLYGKYADVKIGEKKIEDFDPDMVEVFYNGLDLIDETVNTRNPMERTRLNNELGILISPILIAELEEYDKKHPKQPNQKNQPQQNGGSQNANQNMRQQISQTAQNSNGGVSTQSALNQNANNSSSSVTNPNRPGNTNLQQTVSGGSGNNPTGSGNGSGNGQGNGGNQNTPAPNSSTGRGGRGASGSVNQDALTRELDSMLRSNALSQVQADMERERTKSMQDEAEQMEMSESGTKATIKRAAEVPESNKKMYDGLSGKVTSVSHHLAQILLKKMKQYENDDALAWQYSGNKFVSKQYCRDSLKGFQRNLLPREVPNLFVYVLCDESGSVSGKLSDAEVMTSVVFEDFCRTVGVPLCIQGYTSGSSDLDIFSYVEEKKIDANDKYRVTGMSARGGTPTVAAIEYALNRIHKRGGTEKKLLLVITDGGAGDDDWCGTKTRKLLERAKKEKVITIACGIGPDRSQVVAEFGEDHYVDIDDLDAMPMRLLDIIKRNMDGIK